MRGAFPLPLVILPLFKLALHVVTFRGYGFFRDEFYYVACSERLALGYVDHPPLSVLVLWLDRLLLGDSLFAIRLPTSMAGAVTVLVVGLIARELGGRNTAQTLAMLAACAAPVYLGSSHVFSMNALDQLCWALAALLLVRLLKGADPRWWLALGLVLGLGLENKISVLWLGCGIAVGLLLTAERRRLLTLWPWAACGVAAAVFLPHVVWQIQQDWPTVEFIRNATGHKMVEVRPVAFVFGQVRMMNVVTLPLWLAGLAYYFFGREGRNFRLLGWIYVGVFLLLTLNGTSRSGYLAPAYTWLLAAGGVAVEQFVERWRTTWLAWPAYVLLAAGGALFAPFALPVLPVDSYVTYARALGVAPSTAERKQLAELPQFYADMHGWEEIVATVAGVYDGLPADDRAEAGIFALNYGNAGAVDLLGKSYDLPPAISGHNNYWLWGPRDHTGEVLIVMGGSREALLRRFRRVTQAATIECGYCMPYENHRPIWICRDPLVPLPEAWPTLKHYD